MRHGEVKSIGRSVKLRRFALLLFLSLNLGGCFAPRSFLPLPGKERPAEVTAIMPMTPTQVSVRANIPLSFEEYLAALGNVAKDYDEIVEISNAVIDNLAAGSDNPLQGPNKLRMILGDTLELYNERFNVYIDDPGPLDESWKSTGFAELSGKLGITRVVRVKIIVLGKIVETKNDSGVVGGGWDGEVEFTAELWSLAPPRPMAYGAGSAQFWGRIGVVGGAAAAVPFAIGTTFGRAVNKAARQALAELFQHKGEEEGAQ